MIADKDVDRLLILFNTIDYMDDDYLNELERTLSRDNMVHRQIQIRIEIIRISRLRQKPVQAV